MRTKFSVLALMLLTIFTVASPAAAVTSDTLAQYTSCDVFIVAFSTLTFDRDNTGNGTESVYIRVTDGAGNELFYSDTGNLGYPLGYSLSLSALEVYYDVAPAANPIRLQYVSKAGNGLPEQVLWDLTGICEELPVAGAAGIPAGFVFASITCNTPVYNTPAGQPVGDAAVTAGQTWYVNPEPVEGADGQSWTEIYVSSTTNPWIPASCVQ